MILTLKTQDYGLCSGTMQLFVEIFEHARFPVIGRTPECSVWNMIFCENVHFARDEIWLAGALYMHTNPNLLLAKCQICVNGSAYNATIVLW